MKTILPGRYAAFVIRLGIGGITARFPTASVPIFAVESMWVITTLGPSVHGPAKPNFTISDMDTMNRWWICLMPRWYMERDWIGVLTDSPSDYLGTSLTCLDWRLVAHPSKRRGNVMILAHSD
jgi:hypothetical protein